jgi:hypothetical protein
MLKRKLFFSEIFHVHQRIRTSLQQIAPVNLNKFRYRTSIQTQQTFFVYSITNKLKKFTP